MNRLSLKSRLIINTLVILILALGFNAMLTLNSLEKFYVESIASRYSVVDAFGASKIYLMIVSDDAIIIAL